MMKKVFIITAYLLLAGFLILGCAGQKKEEGTGVVEVYYPDEGYTTLLTMERTLLSDTTEGRVDELIKVLEYTPIIKNMTATLNDMAEVKDTRLEGGRLTIDFSVSYNSLNKTEEVLTRAAVVKTLSQVEGVSYIEFSVDGRALRDDDGNEIGSMRGDSFINDTATEISTDDRRKITLYFADMEGYHLKKTGRTVVYTANMSTEKLIIQKLIEGPEGDEDVYPTLSKDTSLLSVSTKNGVCYVNFNAAIHETPYSVAENVVIYSIVNSLTELPNIDKVQIMVEGVSDVMLFDSMSLDKLYERNPDIIQ